MVMDKDVSVGPTGPESKIQKKAAMAKTKIV
jgi:hypothetical protein